MSTSSKNGAYFLLKDATFDRAANRAFKAFDAMVSSAEQALVDQETFECFKKSIPVGAFEIRKACLTLLVADFAVIWGDDMLAEGSEIEQAISGLFNKLRLLLLDLDIF